MRLWLCRCDCGNEGVVLGISLRLGRTKSCGCLQRTIVSNRKGVKHPNYIHGSYCNDKELRKFYDEIRKLDNFKCQICSKMQEEELKDLGHKLSIHHKDSNHYNNEIRNAQTLCSRCHMTVENNIRKTNLCINRLDDIVDINEYNFEGLKELLI